MDENPRMRPSIVEQEEIVPEHFLASLFGTIALALAALVWSGMAAVFGPWSLPAAPGMGWLIAWACRYGGRRADSVVRVTGWLLALAGALLGLLAFSAFAATQASPDSGLGLDAIGAEYLRLFAEPPWFGCLAVLLTLLGAARALRDRTPGRGRAAAFRGVVPASPVAGLRRAAVDDPGSKAA